MFTLLTSPASFASASLAPFPSLHPPPISASWSGYGLSTAAVTLSAPLLQWCGKLRPAATLAAADIEGVHAPVLCLTRRPGSWRQLKAWLHRKMLPQPRECTKAVLVSANGGESPQRVRTWFSGCTDNYATTMAAKVTALSPARRPQPAISEATPCPMPRLKPVRSVPPIHKHRGPKKPAALAVKPCLTLRPTKPKRSVRFAATSHVQEYTRWNYKGQSPGNTELLGSPYERRFKRVAFKTHHDVRGRWIERYLEPDGHNQVHFPRTKWIRDGPTGDDVDADGDVDMG